MRWRGTLSAKEMAQNLSGVIALSVLFGVVLAAQCLYVGLSTGRLLAISFTRTFYWAVFAGVVVLGSAFLADENGAKTTNFLLRLPVRRRRIFFTKIASHLVCLAIYCVLVACLIVFAGSFAPIVRSGKNSLALGDCYEAAIWVGLGYFLAVAYSIVLDKFIAAFLATAATGAAIYAVCLYLGMRLAEALTATSGPNLPNLRAAYVVTNVLLTFILAGAVAVSWRLFARKEGR